MSSKHVYFEDDCSTLPCQSHLTEGDEILDAGLGPFLVFVTLYDVLY